ncbi:GNAT family N-acetyltransferase [Streptomyces sp. XH2]|uniref:GNAT family N-acetyltransferase n=1 Tax=Streptomyces sp. XH2 TaxID=3412483 RepID=UPI003C79D1A7
MPYPIRLAGDAVVLRDFTMDDVDDALKIVGDDRVTTWLSFDSRDRQGTQAMLEGAISRAQEEPRNEYYLAIVAPPSDHVIGFCRIGLSGVRAGKLGYAVAASEWGKGYATDAARTMIDFGFRTLGLHRISAAIGPDNFASIKLIERLGFTREGVLRDHVHTNGTWRDSALFSLLDEEWDQAQTPTTIKA